MSRNIMTGADHIALLESETGVAPAPRETILTNTDGFKSDSESQPLSGIDGDGGATNDPRDDAGGPKDAPKTPSVVSMDEPSRKASVSGGGNKSNPVNKKPSPKSSATDAEDSSEKPWDKKSKKDESDDDMNEDFTFEDADLEADQEEVTEMDQEYMEHDMAAGEIAVTQEFLVKLLAGVSNASLGDEQFEAIAQAIADTAADDRTLDVADIADVMAALKDSMGGADMGGEDDYDEPMDDEPMDDEPMDDEVDECNMDEGSEETRQKGRQKRRNAVADKGRANRGGGPRPKYRKPKAVGGDENVNEAWLAAIPNVGNPKKSLSTTDMTEDEIEMQDIRRLAGMLDPVRRLF